MEYGFNLSWDLIIMDIDLGINYIWSRNTVTGIFQYWDRVVCVFLMRGMYYQCRLVV